MNRRTLLMSLLALAMTQGACRQTNQAMLQVLALKGSLPPQLLTDFRRNLDTDIKVKLTPRKELADLFEQLQQWSQQSAPPSRSRWQFWRRGPVNPVADWVGLGDYWLTFAIQQGLIQPLGSASLPDWETVPEALRSLVQRNDQGMMATDGAIWGTPYRWGSLVMVYDQNAFERLGWQPQQWADLWHPDLVNRVALPSHPRLVLGLVLKSLGYSANDAEPQRHAAIRDQLAALRPQVKTYAADDYLQSLLQGDVWLAVGWTLDIQAIASQYRHLITVVPDPGTILSADVWVKPQPLGAKQPAIATLDTLNQAWLSYWWQPSVQTPLSLFANGLAPLLLNPDASLADFDLSPTKVTRPSTDQLRASEFLHPLSPEAIAQYTDLWEFLRQPAA